MLIDRTQRPWLIASITILLAATLTYIPYAMRSARGPRGNSGLGLIFGIAGYGFIIFAALLGARKKVPVWRIGRAKTWMRGHLWLGLLSLPILLFHGGFHFGGPLTRVLMWLLITTVLSGVVGAALQHILPRVITNQVPLETIVEEIGNVRAQLLEEADQFVAALCGPIGFETSASSKASRAGGFEAKRSAAAIVTPTLSEEESAPVRKFYLLEMRPFLEHPATRARLGDAAKARLAFQHVRTLSPASAQATLEDLENICEEERQLTRQELLHRWLHGWLLVHVPLSLALILLGAVHAVMALRY
jgi:hypothetical protein